LAALINAVISQGILSPVENDGAGTNEEILENEDIEINEGYEEDVLEDEEVSESVLDSPQVEENSSETDSEVEAGSASETETETDSDIENETDTESETDSDIETEIETENGVDSSEFVPWFYNSASEWFVDSDGNNLFTVYDSYDEFIESPMYVTRYENELLSKLTFIQYALALMVALIFLLIFKRK
jgi:hypothetical protein